MRCTKVEEISQCRVHDALLPVHQVPGPQKGRCQTTLYAAVSRLLRSASAAPVMIKTEGHPRHEFALLRQLNLLVLGRPDQAHLGGTISNELMEDLTCFVG